MYFGKKVVFKAKIVEGSITSATSSSSTGLDGELALLMKRRDLLCLLLLERRWVVLEKSVSKCSIWHLTETWFLSIKRKLIALP
jgi:hypothetical protein